MDVTAQVQNYDMFEEMLATQAWMEEKSTKSNERKMAALLSGIASIMHAIYTNSIEGDVIMRSRQLREALAATIQSVENTQ